MDDKLQKMERKQSSSVSCASVEQTGKMKESVHQCICNKQDGCSLKETVGFIQGVDKNSHVKTTGNECQSRVEYKGVHF